MILSAILDFVEETEKRQKKYQANSPRPICILQICRKKPRRGLRVTAERSGGGGRRLGNKLLSLHHRHIVGEDLLIKGKINFFCKQKLEMSPLPQHNHKG